MAGCGVSVVTSTRPMGETLMKLIAILLLSLPLFAVAAEHGGSAAQSKEHGGTAAPSKEHGGTPAESKEHAGNAATPKPGDAAKDALAADESANKADAEGEPAAAKP